MLLFHGTGAGLADVIAREGLRGRSRPTFLARDEQSARRYARARAAQAHAHGGEAVGLIVVVEANGIVVDEDPFGEPGQLRAWSDIPAAAIVEIRRVTFGWGRLSLERSMALSEAFELDRARAEGQDTWRHRTHADVEYGLAQLRKLPTARRDRSAR